ncbi:hypothetical protein H8959_004396 [Pygathrix nigripes]
MECLALAPEIWTLAPNSPGPGPGTQHLLCHFTHKERPFRPGKHPPPACPQPCTATLPPPGRPAPAGGQLWCFSTLGHTVPVSQHSSGRALAGGGVSETEAGVLMHRASGVGSRVWVSTLQRPGTAQAQPAGGK